MQKRLDARQQDRRIKARYRATNLRTEINRRGLINWFEKPQAVACVDINRYGMSFETHHAFKLRERVSIALSGKYINQRNICGVIVSAADIGDSLVRYGVRFSYCTHIKAYSRTIDNALSRIELLHNPTRQSA